MKNLKTLLFAAILFALAGIANAQNVGINSDGSTPAASAMLDVSSTTKGFLAPRMTESQRTTAISLPATGLLVYQTDGAEGFYYYTGSAWTMVGTSSANGTVTGVATGTGLTGGTITTSGTISLASTTVTPGGYTRASITVDAQGRITAAGDGAAVSLTGEVSGILPIANGGTNAATAADARTNLGLGTAAVASTGTASGNVPVLDGSGKIPAALLSVSGMAYQGSKELSANPTVAVETSGNYYIISVAGNETGSSLSFLSGDWMISNGTAWQKITNSAEVSSVAGKTGAVTLDGADITSGTVAIANGGTGQSTADGARTGLGATTLGSNLFTITNPSAITFLRVNSNSTVSALNAADFRTAIGAGSGGGTVTSVTGTLPISVATGTTTPAISISAATTSAAGSMSALDKTKLDGIATNANNYTHPTGDSNLHVPATSTTNSGKVLTAGATAGSLSWNALTSSQWTTTGSNINYNTGNVGIGTSAPASNLTVNGATHCQIQLQSAGVSKGYFWWQSEGYLAVGPGSASNSIIFKDNNVGIGTATPDNAKLHIADASTLASSSSLNISKTGAITGHGYGIKASISGPSLTSYAISGTASATGSSNIGVLGTGSGAAPTNYGVYGYAYAGTTTNYGVYGLAAGTAGTSANYGGYFDNTATSGTKYGVVGRATGSSAGISYGGQFAASGSSTANYGVYGIASGATGTTSRGGIFLNDATASITKYGTYSEAYGAHGTNIGGYFKASGGASNYGLIVEEGNVGIGTTTPGTKLHVDNGALYVHGIDNTANNYTLLLRNQNTDNMMVVYNDGTTYMKGNVGIGTTTPAYDLEVVGNANITDASTTHLSSSLKITKNGTITGDAYGVSSTVSGASQWNEGIQGIASGTGLYNAGLYGLASGASTNTNAGVYGKASGGLLANYGVFGYATGSTGTGTSAGAYLLNNATNAISKYGVYASATGANGTNIGGYFSASSATNNYGLIVANGDVGIGTTAPATKLDVMSATGSGRQDMLRILAGSNSTGNGASMVLGSTQTHAGYISGLQTTSNTGDLTFGTQSNGAYAENMRIVGSNGYVGIGATTPLYKFDVRESRANHVAYIHNSNGTSNSDGVLIRAGVGDVSNGLGAQFITFKNANGTDIGSISQVALATVAYNTTSDRRLKNNIVNTHFGINDLMKIQVRDYVYKADAGNTLTTGFIAQELFEIFPNAVTKPANDDKMWSVDYGKVTPLLVKAIQDQQATIEAQQKTNQDQQAQISDLNLKVEKLTKLIETIQNK